MLVNLTPHTVHVIVGEERVAIPRAASRSARCELEEADAHCVEFGGVQLPIRTRTTTRVSHLPDPTAGTLYIVSRMVATALRGTRDDLLVVDDLVLDENRHVRGCRALTRLA